MTKSIAIVGASSQIAKDLVRSLVAHAQANLLLYVRDVAAMTHWCNAAGIRDGACVLPHAAYGDRAHDVVLNFVGVGDPRRAAEMGASILDITQQFDALVMADLERHPDRRYVFLSSGAVYGNNFAAPVTAQTEAHIPINAIAPQHYYAAAKLHAEIRHRARADLAIVDLRVFNYFSRTQDIDARFFITDILRAVRDGQVLRTSSDPMVRDYLHPADFHQLVMRILEGPPQNRAIDCYSRAPVDKTSLLDAMQHRFGLRYEVVGTSQDVAVNATGAKPHYYSLNFAARELGYEPARTSLEGVLAEAQTLFA